jgi:hypothetical protein
VKVAHHLLQFKEMEFVFHVHLDHFICLIKESVSLAQMVQYLISPQIHVLIHNLCKQIKQIKQMSFMFINAQIKQYIQMLLIHAFVQIIFHSTMVKIVQHVPLVNIGMKLPRLVPHVKMDSFITQLPVIAFNVHLICLLKLMEYALLALKDRSSILIFVFVSFVEQEANSNHQIKLVLLFQFQYALKAQFLHLPLKNVHVLVKSLLQMALTVLLVSFQIIGIPKL